MAATPQVCDSKGDEDEDLHGTCLSGRSSAEEHPDESAGQCYQAHGPGGIEVGNSALVAEPPMISMRESRSLIPSLSAASTSPAAPS